MTKDFCDRFPVKHINSKDIPVYSGETIPTSAQLLMFVTEQDQQCGQFLPFIYKLPAGMILPSTNGNNNVIALNGNGATITVPENQVKAGYVCNNTPNDIRLADSDDETVPHFLILGKNAADTSKYDVITDGVYKFPGQHEYIVGYTYYLGLMGQPTTEDTGTPLFYVLDKYRIKVSL